MKRFEVAFTKNNHREFEEFRTKVSAFKFANKLQAIAQISSLTSITAKQFGKSSFKVLKVLSVVIVSLLICGSCFAEIDAKQAIKCILGESRGEPYAGQCAVGEVLRRSPKIPFYGATTIKEEGGKWFAREKGRWVKLSEETVSNAKMAWLESETSNYSNGATNFEGDRFRRPYWAKDMIVSAHIGSQTFFKNK